MFNKICTILIYIIVYCSLINGQSTITFITSPLPNSIGAAETAEIKIVFNASIDAASINTKTFRISGSNSGIVKGVVVYDKQNNTAVFKPKNKFFAGEVISAEMTGVRDQQGNIIKGYQWRFDIGISKKTNAKFPEAVKYSFPSLNAVAIDIDNDGSIDLATAQGMIFYNNGSGVFNKSTAVPQFVDLSYLSDLNNDGRVDAVCSYQEFNSDSKVYLCDSSGAYNLSQTLYPVNNKGGIITALGDINNDGYPDLIGVEKTGDQTAVWRIFWNDGTGKFIPDSTENSFTTLALNMSLADVNNDGFLDLIVANTLTYPRIFEGFTVYYNDGNGKFTQSKQFTTDNFVDYRQMYIDDFDKDGYLDIAMFGSQLGGRIFINDKNGNFSSSWDKGFSSAGNFGFFTSGDFNGDNMIDILTSNLQVDQALGNMDTVQFDVQINCGNAYFQCSENEEVFDIGIRALVGQTVPIPGDFDNDGALDIMHTGTGNTFLSKNKNVISDVKNDIIIYSFNLSQNYPNPFNPSTVISYQLPKDSKVSLKVFNMLGQEVMTLVNANMEAGTHTVTFDAGKLSSGVYLYKLDAGSFSVSKKMILTK
jgi:hypothetical protein